ncbi:MAG: PilZ domain-containing protein [Microcystaceae cyanobacterium]
MTKSITETYLADSDAFRAGEGNQQQERRSEARIISFCQVFDQQGEFLGVSLDITGQGICLSLPKTWTADSPFPVTLKRVDNPSLADVTVSVEVQWRQDRNDNYDTVGCRIVDADSQSNFEAFVNYCQNAEPHGLC